MELDYYLRKRQVGALAQQLSTLSGKPILSVGAGSWLFGDTKCDIDPTSGVEYCNAQDLSQYANKQFGVCVLSHVLEHLEDPDKALSEAWRVADNVLVEVPSFLHPAAWLCLQHKWVYVGDSRFRTTPMLNWAVLLGGLCATYIVLGRQ